MGSTKQIDQTKSLIDNKSVVETEFNHVLTSSSCTTLIAEIIKYILYNKQQLPYTFDRLKYIIAKKKSIDSEADKSNVSLTKIERSFRIAESGLRSLETILEKTNLEVKSGKIREIALLFGGSPLMPKQVYHIHLPDVCCDHQLTTHQDRKYLIQFLQSVVQSNKLTDMLLKPMNPTNMFTFIKKDVSSSSNDGLSTWFLPKQKFQIPSYGQHFHIKLSNPPSGLKACTCTGFEIFSEDSTYSSDEIEIKEEPVSDSEMQFEWFQACEIFKGFKDVLVNGESVSNLWIR